MTTPVTICNLALSRIGESASISSIDPPDGSASADACARFYPMALATCLESHDWSFATRRVSLAELADSMVEKGTWKHAYAVPASCRRVIDVTPATEDPLPVMRFLGAPQIEYEIVATDSARVLLTDAESPIMCRYVTGDVNASQFSGLFVDALSWLLASYLAGEMIRGDSAFKYASDCQKQFAQFLSLARERDARDVRRNVRHVPTWISRR